MTYPTTPKPTQAERDQVFQDIESGEYENWNWETADMYDVPEEKGVYRIYIVYGLSQRVKLVYVGMSSNLFRRLKTHSVITVLRGIGLFVHVDFFRTLIAEDVEQQLIKKLAPPLNKSSASEWKCKNIKDRQSDGRLWGIDDSIACITRPSGFSIEQMFRDEIFKN